MSSVITGVERDIVLDYVLNKHISFLLYSRSDSQKQFVLQQNMFNIVQKKIVFFLSAAFNSGNNSNKIPLPFTDACVRFFYKGRGLYFNATIKTVRNGYAFVIPDEIQKMADQKEKKSRQCSGLLYYSGADNEPIVCTTLQDYSIFGSNRKGSSVDNYLLLISSKFLEKDFFSNNSIEDRVEPLYILTITDEKILFGFHGTELDFHKEEIYALELKIPAGVVRRRIRIKCIIANTFTKTASEGKKQATTVICDYIGLKLEDKRFLYEQFWGKKFK